MRSEEMKMDNRLKRQIAASAALGMTFLSICTIGLYLHFEPLNENFQRDNLDRWVVPLFVIWQFVQILDKFIMAKEQERTTAEKRISTKFSGVSLGFWIAFLIASAVKWLSTPNLPQLPGYIIFCAYLLVVAGPAADFYNLFISRD